MPKKRTHLSKKQIPQILVGAVVVALLIFVANMYGYFAKTQVVGSTSKFTIRDNIKPTLYDGPGTYTLEFYGKKADGTAVEATTSFQMKAK